jgi:hypothetical protein
MYMTSRGESAVEALPEVVLAMYGFQRGHAQIEHQQGHGEGEDAVAECRKALHTLPGNAVVCRGHEEAGFKVSEFEGFKAHP